MWLIAQAIEIFYDNTTNITIRTLFAHQKKNLLDWLKKAPVHNLLEYRVQALTSVRVILIQILN